MESGKGVPCGYPHGSLPFRHQTRDGGLPPELCSTRLGHESVGTGSTPHPFPRTVVITAMQYPIQMAGHLCKLADNSKLKRRYAGSTALSREVLSNSSHNHLLLPEEDLVFPLPWFPD